MALMSLSPAKTRPPFWGTRGFGANRARDNATNGTLSERRTRQTHVRHRPRQQVKRWDAQSRIRARQALQVEATLQSVAQLLIKALLIALISIGFLYCASAILAATTSILFKSIALSMWACGFVPISYYLWNS